MSDTKPKIQEAQKTPRKINVKKQTKNPTIPRHIIFKLQKIKDKEKIQKEKPKLKYT